MCLRCDPVVGPFLSVMSVPTVPTIRKSARLSRDFSVYEIEAGGRDDSGYEPVLTSRRLPHPVSKGVAHRAGLVAANGRRKNP